MTARVIPTVGRDQLVDGFARLGLAGRSVLLHCSLRRIGPVDGGAATVVEALRTVMGEESTLVVPTQTPSNSNTSDVYRAATRGLDPADLAAYEAGLPGFDPLITPSYGMGAVAEHVRTRPSAVRSSHPQASFAAIGPAAVQWMSIHDLDCHLGERSPLASLYEADVSIVLLGVGFASCTALHLAEHRLPSPPPRQLYRCFVQLDGERRQYDFEAAHLNASDFVSLGADLEADGLVRSEMVGNGLARTVLSRDAVDFAVSWMTDHRNSTGAHI